MSEDSRTVQELLVGLAEQDEILGAIAVSAEGLVMGSAGVEEDDADMLGALGASLVGVAERTMRRLGSSTGARSVSVGTGEGTVQIWARDDVALILLTEPAAATAMAAVAEDTLSSILGTLAPV